MSGFPGGPDDPYREPGEPPSYAPYGSSPYGAHPYGGPPAVAPTDPVSITGFVLSLLCCTSVVGLILGIVGLTRTKDGVRKGRWAAVTAIVVGGVGTLTFVGLVGFFTWFGTSTVSLESVDVGQCVDVDEFSSGHDATLFKKDCDEAHEAEVAVTDEFDQERIDDFELGAARALCSGLLGDDYAAAYATGDYKVGAVFEANDPETGDTFICYLERADGSELDAPIGD